MYISHTQNIFKKISFFPTRLISTGLIVISLVAAGLLACVTPRVVVANTTIADDLPFIPLTESVVQERPFLDFVETVRDENRAKQAVGLFLNAERHFPIVEQPADDDGYVSSNDVTHFRLADRKGSLTLMAHNPAGDGRYFYELTQGQEVVVVKGNGSYDRYQISELRIFQALDPDSARSDFREENSDEVLTASQLFNLIYKKGYLTIQTCVERDGNIAWGRAFWLARRLLDVNGKTTVLPDQTEPPPLPTKMPTPMPTLDPKDAEEVVKEPIPGRAATALCRDGWTSYATPEQRAFACSRHQGVHKWLDQPTPTATAAS